MKFFLDNIILIFAAFASGLMLLWPMVQKRASGPALNAHGVTRMINDQNAVVLDLRDSKEFDAGHVPNARQVAMDQVAQTSSSIDAKKPLILVCANGAKAGKAAAALRSNGRENVFILEAGVAGWREAGLPLVKS